MTLTRRTLLAGGLGIAGAPLLDGCSSKTSTSSPFITLPAQQALTPSRSPSPTPDGFAAQPRETTAFYIGMGERYDVVTRVKDGVFPLVARPIGKDGAAMALLRTGDGQAPSETPALALRELGGPILLGADLSPAESSQLPRKDVGQEIELTLTGQMSPYAWAINGAAYPDNKPVSISKGERVSVNLANKTMMTHPMHLHGHTFALPNGLRKDTVLLKPMQQLAVQLQADNPGNWAAHCHNIYHAEAGMMAALVYAT